MCYLYHVALSRDVMSTHGVDARQLLRELQDDSDDYRLTIVWGAEEFKDGDFLLHGHLHPFLLHLLDVVVYILTATQTHQSCKKMGWYIVKI